MNIINAIMNLVNNPVTHLVNYYQGRNRANNAGDWHTLPQLKDGIPEFREIPGQSVSSLLFTLTKEGKIEKQSAKNIFYRII